MSAISNRLAKLEGQRGDDFAVWLRTASEAEINQRLIELMAKADPSTDWANMTEDQVIEMANKYFEEFSASVRTA